MNTDIHQPLTPHLYPLWIKIGFAFWVSFLFLNVTELPFCFDINKRRKKADAQFDRRNFQSAAMHYTELSILLPKNSYVHIRAAKSLFKSSREKDHILAFALIADLSFTQDEWKDLLKFMPIKYHKLFDDLEEKK